MQLRGDRGKFKRAGAAIALIGLGSPERAGWFCDERRLNGFACLADPDKAAHRAYGLGRGSLRQVLGPQQYIQWMRARLLPEIRHGLPREDIMQMPGTFVIDTGGIVRYVHRNRDASDNPSNEEILGVLDDLR